MKRTKWMPGPVACGIMMGTAFIALAHVGPHDEQRPTKPPVKRQSAPQRPQPNSHGPVNSQSNRSQPNSRAASQNRSRQPQSEEQRIDQMLNQIEARLGRPLTPVEKQRSRRAIETRNAALRAAQEQFRLNMAQILGISPDQLRGRDGGDYEGEEHLDGNRYEHGDTYREENDPLHSDVQAGGDIYPDEDDRRDGIDQPGDDDLGGDDLDDEHHHDGHQHSH